MSEPIDLDAKRRQKQDRLNAREAAIFVCECGCGMFRLWSDGIVECLNCGSAINGLEVVDEDDQVK